MKCDDRRDWKFRPRTKSPGSRVGVGALAYRTGELQRIGPILELETVAAICGDGLPPIEKFQALVGAIEYRGEAAGPCAARIAAWAAVVGVRIPLPRELPPPYAAMLDCDWPGAADAFGAIGWTFDRAFFLSFLDDEDALTEAIGVARELGAAPLARHVAGGCARSASRCRAVSGRRPGRTRSA